MTIKEFLSHYSLPKAYRPISLGVCLGKAIESLVARRLAHLALKHHLLPNTQFGGIRGRSTVDAALTLCHDIESAWNHGLKSTMLTFDISGAFTWVNHRRLLHVLRQKGLPLELVRWVASFLADRKTSILLDGRRDAMSDVVAGIAQGSPISPILWLFFVAPLLELFRDRVRIVGFVDDGALYVSSKDLADNVESLTRAYAVASEWAGANGVKFDFSKRELIHFYKGPRRAEPSISLPGPSGPNVDIKPDPTLRWLGFYLDRTLSFTPHVRYYASKARGIMANWRLLGNTRRGLSQLFLRRLYVACVLSVATYGSALYWHSDSGLKLQREREREHPLLSWRSPEVTQETTSLTTVK